MSDFRVALRDNGPERVKDMTGVRVGMLTVQRQAPSMGMNARWHCVCDCGGKDGHPGTRVMTGSTLRPRPIDFKAAIAQNLRDKVWPLLEAKTIKPEIFKTFALADAAEAHTLMESSQHIGKIVLTV